MKEKKEIYTHFKGCTYKVIGVAKYLEILEKLIIYIDIDNENSIWLRPKNIFLKNVTKDGKKHFLDLNL